MNSSYTDNQAFTASEQEYADAILNQIDKFNCIQYRLYRNSCIVRGEHRIKDLRILNRDLRHVVIIDNTIVSFMSQIENGVPITPFTGDMSDICLTELLGYLQELKDSEDVRVHLKEMFNIKERMGGKHN